MTSLTMTLPTYRPSRGRVSNAPIAGSNPHRPAVCNAQRESEVRDEDDLGAWVRLPEGGLELRD